jgi:3-hydroxyacyl-[acyl-carrier-protein] dehydratase
MTTLFTISNLSVTGQNFIAKITFNPAHLVFEGHFPGKPIVPGVVMVEIAAALITKVTGKDLQVKEASVIKFLQVIEPFAHPVVNVSGSISPGDDGVYRADLDFKSGQLVFAKLKGIRLVAE